MSRLGRNFRRKKQRSLSLEPSLWLDFAHEPVLKKGIGSLSVTRAGNTATARCFAENDNPGSALKNIVIPANTPRYRGKRYIASNNTWSDKYADGSPIEEFYLTGIYSETSSTNLYLNSATLVTQNNITTTRIYTLSFYGTGSVTLSGTATGTLTGTGANERVILTFTATAGTLTSTVSGSVTEAQLESKPFASSYIPTAGASVTRNADIITFPNTGNVSDIAGTLLMEVTPGFDIPSSTAPGFGSNFLLDLGDFAGVVYIERGSIHRQDGTTTISTPAWSPLKDTTYKIGSSYGSTGQRNWLNGTSGTNGAFDGSINSGTDMSIGGFFIGTAFNWGGTIGSIRIWKRQLTDSQIVDLQKEYLTDENGNFLTDETNDRIWGF